MNEPASLLRSSRGLTVLGTPFHVRQVPWQVTQLLAPEEPASRCVAKTASFHLGTIPPFIIYEEEQDVRSPH